MTQGGIVMDKDHSMMSKKQKDTNRVKIISSVLLSGILFIAEMFFMTSENRNFIVIGILAVLMLISICVCLIFVLSESQRKIIRREEQYNNIFKSEKATYVKMRKSFEELEARIAILENNTNDTKEEIISTQKAAAKVSINRTRENTDAILNSNDKLIDKMFDLETQINDTNALILENEKKLLDESNQEILQKQLEVVELIKTLETSLKKMESTVVEHITEQVSQAVKERVVSKEESEIGETIGQFSFVQEDAKEEFASETGSTEEPESEIGETIGQFSFAQENAEEEPTVTATVEEEAVSDVGLEEEPVSDVGLEEEPISDIGLEEEAVGDIGLEEEAVSDIGLEEEPVSDIGLEEEPVSDIGLEEEAVSDIGLEEEAVNDIGLEEEPKKKTLVIKDEDMGFDEIVAIADDVLNDVELQTEEEKKALEEEKVPEVMNEEEPEPVVEEETPVEEKVEEPIVEEPKTESANKIMSPDEIAKLIANTTATAAPIIEEPTPVVEEVPKADPLSDPNKIMTADEIAALISSL